MSTHIVFVRHGDHKQNVLTEEARAGAIKLGERLHEAGYTIESCISSPLGRCVATGLCVMQGNGKIQLIYTAPELGDISSDTKLPHDFMDVWRSFAIKQFGSSSDANLAKVMTRNDTIKEHMLRRAEEGARVLRNINKAHQFSTILVVSHAVARMEISLRELRGVKNVLDIPDEEIFEKGGCAVVEMDCGKVISISRIS